MGNSNQSLKEVEKFWNDNPLFSGESNYEPGSHDFFEEHKKTYYNDCFAGKFNDQKLFPSDLSNSRVLDLGCGVGFWTIEIQKYRKVKEFFSADLTPNAIEITKKRLGIYGLNSNLSIENAENMTYPDAFFDHVNCQGVIHHTPDTDASIKEIARVLKPGATAYISVYYKNFFIRNWKKLSFFGFIFSKLGAKLKGRGRENLFTIRDTDEITRLYDGEKNPIGKSYTKKQIIKMLAPYFKVKKTFLFFFPARALPFKIPRFLHRFLARHFGFMIFLQLEKK